MFQCAKKLLFARDANYSFRARFRSAIKLDVKHARLTHCQLSRRISSVFSPPPFFRYPLSTSDFQLRKSVEASLCLSRNQEVPSERFVGSRWSGSAAFAGDDTPFNVSIRRVYIFNWSLKFTLVTPVAATEAISCANKLRWIKLYDGAWMKFIV